MATDAGTAYIDVEARLDKLDDDLDKKAGGIFSKFGSKGGDAAGAGFKGAFGGVLAGLGTDRLIQGAFDFVGDSLAEGMEKIKLDARISTLVTNAASIGSQVSVGAFDEIGRQLGKQLVIDDDDVRAGIAPLLNIPNLTQPMFARLSQLSVDTAAATNKGIGEVSTLVSRISQAPDQAARSFRSLGIIVSDETVKIVDDLVSQGKTAEATSVLVGELEKRYGGAAKAAGDAAGPQQKFGVALDDLKEKVGVALVPTLEKLTPVLLEIANLAGTILPPLFTALGPVLEFMGDHAEIFIGAFLPIAGAFYAVKSAVEGLPGVLRSAMTTVVDIFLAGVEWIVNGAARAFGWVPGIGPKLRDAADKIEAFRDEANAALSGVQDKTVTVRVEHVDNYSKTYGAGYTGGDNAEGVYALGLEMGPIPGVGPVPIIAHGGERVVTPEQWEDLRSTPQRSSAAPTSAPDPGHGHDIYLNGEKVGEASATGVKKAFGSMQLAYS